MDKTFVYIIKSEDNIYYIGETSNLEDRLTRHNTRRSKYTSARNNWELVIYYACNSKSEACQLERKLKNFKNSQKAIEYLKRLNAENPENK